MHRLSPVLAACLTLGLAAVARPPAPGDRGRMVDVPAARAAPAAPAQADPTAPVIEATVHADGLTVRTAPGTQVLVDLVDAAGEEKASSAAVAGDDGLAPIAFGSYVLGGGNIAVVRVGGPATVLEPGDVLRVLQAGAATRRIEVPDLTADVDVANDRVAGTGPAGAVLHADVALGSDPPSGRDVTIGANGRWALDLGPAVDLGAVPAVSVSAHVDLGDGVRFHAHARTLSGAVTLGASEARGTASPGTRVGITIETPDGQTLQYGPELVIGDGRWSLALGGGAFGPVGPAGPGQAPPPHRVQAGDRVTLTQTGGPLAADRAVVVSVPELTLAIDPGVDGVTGRAPAGAALRLVASSIWGGEAAVDATAATDGRFTASFAGLADLVPGWRVTAWWAPAPLEGLRAGAIAVIPVVEVGVGVARLGGLAEPGRAITVTLSTPAGEVRSRQTTAAGADGGFAVQHRPPSAGGGFVFGGATLPATPGDRVAVEATAGDPLVLTVPELTATSDAAADTVRGAAPAGTRLRVTATAPGTAAVAVETTADASGLYTADFGGRLDIAPGALGRVTAIDGRGNTYFTPWAAPRLALQVGAPGLGGTAAPGLPVAARLTAPDGTVVAEAATVVPDYAGLGFAGAETFAPQSGGFFLRFEDIAGEGVPVQPGDTVRVTSGAETAEVKVPVLDGTVIVESDLVTGHTEPGRAVAIQAVPFGGGRATVGVVADANGAFSHAFAGRPDLRYNDTVSLVLDAGGHSVARTVTVPGLTLDLDASRLGGTVWPNTRFRLEARRGAAVFATATGVSAPDGILDARLVDAAGAPVPLRPGDQLAVVLITRQGGAPLEMTVPELSITADAAADRVAGRATPGGRLVVLAGSAGAGFSLSQAWPDIAADGAWAADFVPRWDVAPGTAVAAQYHLPEGHVARRTHYVPQLRAEIGGPNVCGFARPGGAVTAELREAGAARATARAGARFDGRFQAVLRDAGGTLAATAGGQTVAADVAGTAAQVDLPALDAAMDWAGGVLSGTAPAGTTFEIGYPARRCVENVAFGDTFQIGLLGRSGPDGSIRARFPLPVAPGEGIELTVTQPDGHQAWRQLYRLLGQAFVGTGRVTGRANAGAAIRIDLEGADGSTRGSAAVQADADGRFVAELRDGAGAPVALRAGDRIAFTHGDVETARFAIEPLAFDWSRGEPVSGTAAPGRAVTLALKLADGRVLSIPRVAGNDGAWRLTAAEVPPRGTWTLDDVVDIRATVETPEGHQVIFETPGFDPEAPGPKPPAGGIFLPWLGRSASPRGAVAAGGSGNRADGDGVGVGDAAAAGDGRVVRVPGAEGIAGSASALGNPTAMGDVAAAWRRQLESSGNPVAWRSASERSEHPTATGWVIVRGWER